MKRLAIAGLALSIFVSSLTAQEPLTRRESNYSLRNEVGLAIDRGFAWLRRQQRLNGSWTGPEHPEATALALTAFLYAPGGTYRNQPQPDFIRKGFDFLRSGARSNGAIFDQGASTRVTSLCLNAFVIRGDPDDSSIVTKARLYIVAQQVKSTREKLFDGGIGDGPVPVKNQPRPDLPGTCLALEALRNLASQQSAQSGPDVDWKAAAAFAGRCQILAGKSSKSKATPDDEGGFLDSPPASVDNRPARSTPQIVTGSTSAAGLLAYIYAGSKRDDPQVVAAEDWLKKHFVPGENPGAGPSGRYTYLLSVGKAFSIAGFEDIKMNNGRTIDWAREMALKLMDLQKSDGSWVNEGTSRWMENDPVTATCDALMALEISYNGL